MQSWNLVSFCDRWIAKAGEYNSETLSSSFDKFFTLYVVYNKLYVEVFQEILSKDPKLSKKYRTFPDQKAATDYIIQYLGATNLVSCVESNQCAKRAIESILSHVNVGKYNIILHRMNGTPDPEKDKELLANLRSNTAGNKAKAITDLIYAVRCNLFHGHKQFSDVQKELIDPVNIILETLVKGVYAKLST